MRPLLSRRQLLACGSAAVASAAFAQVTASHANAAAPPSTFPHETWNILPVRALLLSAPAPGDVPLFCEFIRKALPAEGINTLVVRFRYSYQFKSHPELADMRAISKEQVAQIAEACRDAGVKLIPKMNLLAHQSEEARILPLLAKYPQLDESPDFGPPNPWVDPKGVNDFYSKSVCTLHPELDKIVFALMDDLIDACRRDGPCVVGIVSRRGLRAGFPGVSLGGVKLLDASRIGPRTELAANAVDLLSPVAASVCLKWEISPRLLRFALALWLFGQHPGMMRRWCVGPWACHHNLARECRLRVS
jgi:hypothetical protein